MKATLRMEKGTAEGSKLALKINSEMVNGRMIYSMDTDLLNLKMLATKDNLNLGNLTVLVN